MRCTQAWVAYGVVALAAVGLAPREAVGKAAWGSIGKYEVHLVSTPGSRWIIVTDPDTGKTEYGHDHGTTGLMREVGISNGSPATLIYTDGVGGVNPIGPGGSQLGPHVVGSNLHIDLGQIGPLDATTNKDVVVDLLLDTPDPANPASAWQMRLEFGGHGVAGPDGARLYALELDAMGNVLENLFTNRFGFDYLPIDYSTGSVDIMFMNPMVPEPSSLALAALGALTCAAAAYRQRRRR